MVKNLPVNAGDLRDTGLIPGSVFMPGESHGRVTKWAMVHRVAKSQA